MIGFSRHESTPMSDVTWELDKLNTVCENVFITGHPASLFQPIVPTRLCTSTTLLNDRELLDLMIGEDY